ncbi:hypothetical protein Clacol_010519 [Clathrus columnatus]|uniref:Ricin B lectin domain-containing protein n=1 Tax=Clathrus columnatus TaxID=1419009 RepID=A0AAV5AT92_9AGAM|nr:hypothetical protein Clacol_010519 [Clathrus columnatus]
MVGRLEAIFETCLVLNPTSLQVCLEEKSLALLLYKKGFHCVVIHLDIFFDDAFNGSVVSNGMVAFDVDSDFDGHISANPIGGTYAGLYIPWDYYYIVRNSSYFNVGVSVTPGDKRPTNGFCGVASCDSANCATAFDSQPDLAKIDPIPGTPPTPPMYGCGYGNVYNVTWCPSGTFPDQSSIPRSIHPKGDPSKCLDVRNNIHVNGNPVQVFDCNGSGAQLWLLSRGETRVRLAETDFCLDASSSQFILFLISIGLPQQLWVYTADDHLNVFGRGQCLDVRNGDMANGNQLQIWPCTPGDPNQVFTI